jgi:hypothetical protein
LHSAKRLEPATDVNLRRAPAFRAWGAFELGHLGLMNGSGITRALCQTQKNRPMGGYLIGNLVAGAGFGLHRTRVVLMSKNTN